MPSVKEFIQNLLITPEAKPYAQYNEMLINIQSKNSTYDMMYAWSIRSHKGKILPLKLWQYTEVLAVAPYVLSLYTSRLLLILSYVSGVSVPAEESQYIYLYPRMIIA